MQQGGILIHIVTYQPFHAVFRFPKLYQLAQAIIICSGRLGVNPFGTMLKGDDNEIW